MAKVSKSILQAYNKCLELATKYANILDSYWHKDEKIPFSSLEATPVTDVSHKLDKGGFDGTAQDLKVFIDSKLDKSGGTITGDLFLAKAAEALKVKFRNNSDFASNNGTSILQITGDDDLEPKNVHVFIQENNELRQLATRPWVNAELNAALASKENAFTKNTAFNKDFGTAAGTVAQGNDSRIVNGQIAFDKKVNSIAFSGDTNKILTLTRQDGTTLTASFNDIDTDSDAYLNGLNFDKNNGNFIAVLNDSNTSSVNLDGRYSLLGHEHTFGSLISKPTTISGYGITDAFTKTETNNYLANKVDKVTGKGLSTNDYTTAEKNKLSSISTVAEVNVNADWNAASGDTQILNKPDLSLKANLSGATFTGAVSAPNFTGNWNGKTQADFNSKFDATNLTGITIPAIIDGTDLNTVSTGIVSNYGSKSYWKNPPVFEYGLVKTIIGYAGASIKEQEFVDIRHSKTDFGDKYFRTYNSSGWSSWAKILHDKNFGKTQIEALALNYNSLSNLPTYDNYSYFNLKTNGIQRKTIQSQNDLDFVNGTGILQNYAAGGVVNTALDTNYLNNNYFTNANTINLAYQKGITFIGSAGGTNPPQQAGSFMPNLLVIEGAGIFNFKDTLRYKNEDLDSRFVKPSGNVDTVDGFHVWSGTQAAYDAIATKSANTIYHIT